MHTSTLNVCILQAVTWKWRCLSSLLNGGFIFYFSVTLWNKKKSCVIKLSCSTAIWCCGLYVCFWPALIYFVLKMFLICLCFLWRTADLLWLNEMCLMWIKKKSKTNAETYSDFFYHNHSEDLLRKLYFPMNLYIHC